VSYIQGFLLPVPEGNKATYQKMAQDAWPTFEKYGALRLVETWAVDLSGDQGAAFRAAAGAKDGEAVVFSWIEWPDRETCDRAAAAMEADPEMEMPAEMPFEFERMMWGGFEAIVDEG
jgi:uncharacterized protein YbaA (DUF1428 family)